MRGAFYLCDFTEDQAYWDVSKVENISRLFSVGKGSSDISQWDVSSVKYMDGLFSNAYEFSSDISKWDTSSVEDMDYMFNRTKSFNRNLRGWDVGKVTKCVSFKRDALLLTDAHTPDFQSCTPTPAP